MSLVYWDTMLFARLHLACAAEARVDLFLTHDKRLAKKIIPGIQFIATLDTDIL